jgi:transposase
MQTGNGNRPANQNDIMALYGVSERTAYRWWQEWQEWQEMAPELDGEKRN